MADPIRILFGVATICPDRRFLSGLASFADGVARNMPCVEVDYESGWIWNHTIEEAQNRLADITLDGKYDYLLIMEDDHWAFKWEMLQTCLDANTHVAGISYRSRHFPFDVVPMIYMSTLPDGTRMFKGMNDASKYTGYHPCDLLGFGFTLIKSETFRIIDRPFFTENSKKYPGVGIRATDILFAESLQSKGIQPIGCFQHRLNHREIEESTYVKLMVEGVINKTSLFGTLRSVDKFNKIQEEFERNRQENVKLKEARDARN